MRKIGTVMTLFILMLLISCGPGKKRSNAGDEAVDASKFPIETSNKDAAVKDAVCSSMVYRMCAVLGYRD